MLATATTNEAGIAHFNLVRVSSIFPPGCRIIEAEEGLPLLQAGEIVFAVIAEMSSNEPGRRIAASIGVARPADPDKYGYLQDQIETPEFTGHVIWALYNDPNLMELSGQTLIGAELAVKYGVQDEGGRQPPSYRETHKVVPHVQYPNIIR